MITDIIFDFFGTLVIYDPNLTDQSYKCCQRTLAEKEYFVAHDRFITSFWSVFAELEEKAKSDFKEFHMIEVAQLYFKREFGVGVEQEIAKDLIVQFMEAWGKGIMYHPGIKEFLEKLSKDFRLSIISNTHWPPIIHEHLHRMKVHSLFTEIVTSAEHGNRKPHTSIFMDTINKLSVEPQNVLYVGDSLYEDYIGAKNAGLKAILIDESSKYRSLDGKRISNILKLIDHLSVV
jgi:putative hydrolase of the HAD superfamily